MSPAEDSSTQYRRRGLLAAAGSAALAATAGCAALPGSGRRYESDAVLTGPQAPWPSKMSGAGRRSAAAGPLPGDATTLVEGLTGAGDRRPVVGPEAVFLAAEQVTLPGSERAGRIVALGGAANVRWQYPVPNANAFPAVAGDTVLVQGDALFALDRRDGRLRWRVDAGYAWWRTAPVVAGGTLLVTAADPETVWGLDPATGRRRWVADLRLHPRALAAGDPGAYAVTSDSDESALVRLDPASGEVAWRRPTAAEPGTPVLGTDRVFLREGDRLTARRGADGSVAWSRSLAPRAVALGRERCLVVAGDGRLRALRRSDGTTDWTGPAVARVESGPVAVAGDRVYVPVTDGPALAALDAASGDRVRTVPLPGRPTTGVAVGDGLGALVTRDGTGGRVVLLA